MMRTVRIFVASSSENLHVTHALCRVLARKRNSPFRLDTAPWDQGTFKLSAGYIESLEKEMDKADFAVMILTPNDVTRIRDEEVLSPRDNVLFELGLFMGRLHRERCYMLYESDNKPKLPSDLLGVEPATYRLPARLAGVKAEDYKKRDIADLEKALAPAVEKIVNSVSEILGGDELVSFIAGIEGAWWERIETKTGYELSYFTIRARDKYRSLDMWGDHFDVGGEPIGSWNSVAVGIQETQRKVSYHWEGRHPPKPDGSASHVQGFGTFEFGAALGSIERGKGGFMDVNPNVMATAQWKTVRLKRIANQRHINTMTKKRLVDKKALVKDVLNNW